jgi:transcriptional regulator with XRE-family HTH domain
MTLSIGQKIKSFRSLAGLTQEKLADKVNFSLRYIQHIEDGTRIPIILTLQKIAKALKCRVKDLIDF